MSSGPVIVAMLAAAARDQERRRRARPAAVVRVDVRDLRGCVAGRPVSTVGTPAATSRCGSRSSPWRHVSIDPVDVALADVALDLHVLAVALREQHDELELGVGDRREQPLDERGEKGSEKISASGSESTSAIVSVRRVTRLRAARFGTYPSRATASSTASRVAGLTGAEPFSTRDTVAMETPARLATSSSVGRSGRAGTDLLTRPIMNADPGGSARAWLEDEHAEPGAEPLEPARDVPARLPHRAGAAEHGREPCELAGDAALLRELARELVSAASSAESTSRRCLCVSSTRSSSRRRRRSSARASSSAASSADERKRHRGRRSARANSAAGVREEARRRGRGRCRGGGASRPRQPGRRSRRACRERPPRAGDARPASPISRPRNRSRRGRALGGASPDSRVGAPQADGRPRGSRLRACDS